MKFFNIDLHVSVIADIEKIFNDLGHTVDINYLSNHSWVFNKEPNNTFCINQNNWKNIDKKMCDDFYSQNKSKLQEYDGFIVTHIPAISLLYEKFNKPIIFVASTRYEYPFTNDHNRWHWFNNFINNNDKIIPVANNLYDKWYCEQFLDKEFEYIPSLCEYTNSTYKNGHKSFLYSKKLNILNKDIINKDLIGKYTWNSLFKVKSMIHIPYNVSTMSIFEQYTANVPLLFPTKEYLFKLCKENLTFTEISYNQVLGLKNKSVINYKHIDPNNFLDDELIYKSIELSDFYNDMKFITYFESIEDLNEKMSIDFNTISENMKIYNETRKYNIYKKWENIINKIC